MVKTYAKKPLAIFNGEEVSVVDNGFEFKIKAYGNTVIEILKKSGITVKEQDIVFPTGTLKKNQKIIILRATPVTLNILGKIKKVYTHKKTIREFLEEENIKILSNQFINHSLDEVIFSGIEIKISKKTKPRPVLQKIPKIEKENLTTQRNLKIKSKPSLKLRPAPKIETTGEIQTGLASWYGYIPGNYCASLRFPRGTKLKVTNTANGKSVIVTVNDRGPFNGRVIDLERNAFSQISSLSAGVASVRIERIR